MSPGNERSKPHPVSTWLWRLFFVASVSFAWYSFYVPASGIDWAADPAAAEREAEASGRPIVYYFSGEW
ncbi:MAG: hypothetical protein ACYTF3_13715 [Planctomycetota bacterium]|jgi:protein disulfide-isomerase